MTRLSNVTDAPRIRVLLADDHALVREGLRYVLDADPLIEVAQFFKHPFVFGANPRGEAVRGGVLEWGRGGRQKNFWRKMI